MTRSSRGAPAMKSRVLAALTTLMVVGAGSSALTGAAQAATPECELHPQAPCISVFSSELGTYADPNFVEAVLGGGEATVGQPVGLKPASSTDPSEDILPHATVPNATVADFFAAGMVSAEANSHYGHLPAVQQKYAPFGVATDLCVGLAHVKQNEGLTLQPCDDPTTVWVVQMDLATEQGYFPIVNAATTHFERPFSMHLPRNLVASGRPLQMKARRLQFQEDGSLKPRQLWGANFGVQ